MAGTFDEKLNDYGFERVQTAADKLHHVISAEGSATFRRGPVRIEVAGASLGVHKGEVVLYDARGLELVLCAVVTDQSSRGAGHASHAVTDLITALKSMRYKRVWLEPWPIRKYRAGLGREALVSWYTRLGFVASPESATIMVMDLDKTTRSEFR